MLILINESKFLHIELDIIDMNAYILVLKLITIGYHTIYNFSEINFKSLFDKF